MRARRRPRVLCSLFAAACCAGCTPAGDARGSGQIPLDASDGAPSLLPSQLPPDFHCDPTLASIRETIFLTSCKWDSCHGANNATWGLNLVTEAGTVEGELVGVAAAGCKAWTRVVPGAPESSLLWRKLSDAHPSCGERMPRGVVPLPPEALDCVRQWILRL